MALMAQFCACCRITVPQHSKQSKNFLQSGILSPIFFYAGYTLSIIYFAPAHGKSDFLSAACLSTKQPRPVHARTGLFFSRYLSVPYIFPCLRRRERQSAIMAINSLFVGFPLMPETV